MAQSIGEIISSNGNMRIISEGWKWREIISNTINIGDKVLLDDQSSVIIRINDSFDAKVEGPAEFQIIASDDSESNHYNIQFTNGDYISVDSLTTTSATTDTDLSVEMADGVIIKANPHTKQAKTAVSFVVDQSKGTQKTIVNKGEGELVVTSSDTETNILWSNNNTIIASAQIAEISTQTDKSAGGVDINIVASTPIIALGSAEMVSWATSDLSAASIASPTALTASSLTTTNGTGEITAAAKEVKTPRYTPDGKRILAPETAYKLQQNMYRSFVRNDMNNIAYYHLLGNQQASVIARNNLSSRLQNIASILWLKWLREGNSLNDLTLTTYYLIGKLETRYNTDPKVLNNMYSIKNRLLLLQKYPSGKVSSLDKADDKPSLDEVFDEAWFAAKWSLYLFR